MNDRVRELPEILDTLLPEAELKALAHRIGAHTPIAGFRLQVRNIVAFAYAVALSNPHSWREQKRGFKRVAKAANKAATALRELENALSDERWVLPGNS